MLELRPYQRESLSKYGPWLPSRSEAIRLGARHFFTALPCKHGHIAPRHTSNSTCLECTKIRVARWLKSNPETAARMRADALARQAEDYERDPEKYADRVKRSRERHLEKFRMREREYRLAHKEGHRARVRNRRARIKGSGGTHTASDVESILTRQKYKCAECGASVRNARREIDHIVPIKLGGSNDRRNLQILCPDCNRSKGAKHPIDFAVRKGRLL